MSVFKEERAVDNDNVAAQYRAVKRELFKTDAERSTDICEEYLKTEEVDMNMIKCGICGKLMKLRNLKTHIRNMHNNTKYPCKICGEIMTSKAKLSFHINKIHRIDAENSMYSCDYCQKLFTHKSKIARHIMSMHPSRSYKCDECKKSFVCEKYLNNHKANMHPKLRKQCNICGKLVRLLSFRRHIFNKHSGRKHQCKICEEFTTSQASLTSHMNNVHRNQPIDGNNGTYACDYCQKLFPDKFVMARHIICVHAGGSYQCDKCEKSYVCKVYLKAHKTNVHKARKNKCNVCGKSVMRLKNHMLGVHGYTKYQCDICGEVMMSKACLNCHKNDVHLNQPIEALNMCHYCKKSYTSKFTLKYHMTNLHGNRDHKCSRCTVDFQKEQRIWNNLKSEHSEEANGESIQESACNRSEKENGGSAHCSIDQLNITGSTSSQRHGIIGVKKEPVDEILDVGPVVFQHMDCNYRPLKEEPLFDRCT